MAKATPAPPIRLAIWTNPSSASLAAGVAEALGKKASVVAIGSPSQSSLDALKSHTDASHEDDLRKLVVEHEADALLLTAPREIGHEEISAALDKFAVVCCTEPPADTHDALDRLPQPASPQAAGQLLFAPQFTRGPGFLHAAEPDEALGNSRTLRMTHLGTNERSLFARLFDAWLAVLRFTELPERIDASLVGSALPSPQDLRAMAGLLAAHARTTDGSILIEASDNAAVPRKTLRVIGTDARLWVGSTGYQLYDNTGQPLDSTQEQAKPPSTADLIADQLLRAIHGDNTTAPPHIAWRQALACCQACLLSAHTGQPEDPQKLNAMRL